MKEHQPYHGASRPEVHDSLRGTARGGEGAEDHRVFGESGDRGSLVISGANGIVGAGKTMQLGSRLGPYGVQIIALDFPGAPDGIGKQYPGLVRAFGKEGAEFHLARAAAQREVLRNRPALGVQMQADPVGVRLPVLMGAARPVPIQRHPFRAEAQILHDLAVAVVNPFVKYAQGLPRARDPWKGCCALTRTALPNNGALRFRAL